MEYNKCNLCGNQEFTIVHENILDFVSGEKFNIIKCTGCGLMITSPFPSPENLGKYYPRTYYSYVEGKDYLSARVGRMIKEYFVSPPKNIIKRFIIGLISKIIKKFIAILIEGEGNGRKLLDVGCGDGRRVAWLIHHNFQVYGTEIDKNACNRAKKRGIEVFNGELWDAGYPSDFFDIITFSQVFEHLHNPQRVLEECFRILKSNGILIIDVPNIDSLIHTIYGKHTFHLEVPRHLYHFSKATLSRYLLKNNFKILQWKYRYPRFFDRASLKRLLRQREYGLFIRSIVGSLFFMFAFPFLSDRINKFSQTIAVYARKG